MTQRLWWQKNSLHLISNISCPPTSCCGVPCSRPPPPTGCWTSSPWLDWLNRRKSSWRTNIESRQSKFDWRLPSFNLLRQPNMQAREVASKITWPREGKGRIIKFKNVTLMFKSLNYLLWSTSTLSPSFILREIEKDDSVFRMITVRHPFQRSVWWNWCWQVSIKY